MYEPRYIIGIDLGTTNIAVTFTDTYTDDNLIEQFLIPQSKSVGECFESPLLPACFYKPDAETIVEGSIQLPWDKDADFCVGLYARDHGTENGSRFISSSKSWLCHSGVDRSSKILPWGETDSTEKFSPVEITTYYLEHIKSAWNSSFSKKNDSNGEPCLLNTQQVVITIPASFDETARELTLVAAENAGYKNISLIEEPLSVF